ncbi:hypothetical protein CAEBREN_08999 [Caenorhabditis brenneri]|uniref:Uncharacterized protein n=1 Tax=Caenorhabditis brenneri TaxID=135651 RepID=G0MPP9_CAEBE|nr:hypothetical protein CAEBREN_08999 [Caenorhabditis brenneri]
MIVLYFLILLFFPLLSSTTTTAGLFDLAEYRRVSYDATIGENFLWFAPELDIREVTPDNIDAFEKQITDKIPDESFPNYVFVTSKGGQRFACSIPEVEELKYECDSQLSTNEAYISSLVEVVPCQYLMIVKVGSLCSYPEFLPVTLANTKKIGCHPHLTKEEVREILERQLEEKRQEEQLLNKMATAKQAFRRAIERFNAMTKSARTMNIADYVKKTNAEMNYRASYFNLLIASLADYDTITDENRGHLWHYFNDPTWPKNEFPKDIIATAIQNGYVAEVQDNLRGKYVFEDAGGKLTEGLNEFLKTGQIDLETNLVITAKEIYEEIIMIIHDESMMKHNWLNWISLFFTEDLDRMENEFPETMESTMESIIEPSTEFFWPLGNLAFVLFFIELVLIVFYFRNEALLTIHDDVWQDMIELSKYGPKSELLDPKSWNYKAIYKPLQIVPFPENKPLKVGEKVFHYNVTMSEEKTKLYFTLEYLRLLAPVYKLLSIEWFLDKNRQYFHTRPPTDDFLVDGESDDYKFHYNLARDMAMFSRMLTFSTQLRIQDFEEWRDGERARPRSVESVRKIIKNNPVDVPIKLFDVCLFSILCTYLFYFQLSEIILQNEVGPLVVALARERIWKRRVERYRMNYWTKDYKLRKQAKSMQGMMMDMLSIKDDTVSFATLGGNTESKKKDKFDRKFDDYLMEKLSKFTNIEDIDFDAIKKTFESIIDEGSLEFDDIEQVFDLLEKAGLTKNSEVKFKIFEEDRIEMVKDQMMTEYTNNLFMEEEDRNKMKNSEKAYMKKVITEIQKKLEEDGE